MSGLPFRPGKLTIRGQALMRAAVNPSTKEDHTEWILDVVRSPSNDNKAPEFAVFADLHAVHSGRLVGVTFVSFVVLPKKVDPKEVAEVELAAAVSDLFGESLWDAAAFAARQLAAMADIRGFYLPRIPPPASGTFALDAAEN